MSCEQAPRTFERPKSKQTPASEMLLTEGVPTPVTLAPSFENAQTFFSAISFPIDGKNVPTPFRIQINYGIEDEREVRNWEILGRHLGTDAVGEEIGGRYRIRRERVRQIIEELIDQSYDTVPAALRKAFSRESLATKKPYSLHKGMRISEAGGGKMREVIEAVLARKNYTEIQKETGASSGMLAYHRRKGITIPYLIEVKGKEYQENLRLLADGLLDDRQILKIFKDIEKHNRHHVCESLKKAGALVTLGKAARNEGVFIHTVEFAAYRFLKELAVPVLRVERHFTDKSREQLTAKYFFVLNNHEKTRKAFAKASFDAFRTNPVQVLGRVPEEIPTTSIMNDHEYISVRKFLREKGIPITTQKARKYLGPDCPVSVFYIPDKRRSGVSLLARQDQDALAGYLGVKLAP